MQGIFRVRSYRRNVVYFTFADSCDRQHIDLTKEEIDMKFAQDITRKIANREYSTTTAENAIVGWKDCDWLRQVHKINVVEEQMKIFQYKEQFLAYMKACGIVLADYDEDQHIEQIDDDHTDESEQGKKKNQTKPIYRDIKDITPVQADEIMSLKVKGEATDEQKLQLMKHKYDKYDKYLAPKRERLVDVEEKVFDEIWVKPDMKQKLFHVFFNGLDHDRYGKIDLVDQYRHGFRFNADMGAARLRIVDKLVQFLLGEEQGPTETRAVLLTDGMKIEKANIERAAKYVHENRGNIYETFELRNRSQEIELDFGKRLKLLNHVLLAWGFAKIVSKQVKVKQDRHREYLIRSSIDGLSLKEIYGMLRYLLYRTEEEEKKQNYKRYRESVFDPNGKRPRIEMENE